MIINITNAMKNSYDNCKKKAAKKWEMTDCMSDRVKEMARKDATNSVYMGDDYHSFIRGELSKVAPDRNAAIAQATRLMNQSVSERAHNAKIVQEADKRILYQLFGIPYKAKFEDGALGTGVHIFDENNDEILTYTPNVGWHQKSSRAELEVYNTMKEIYYEAYHEARKECSTDGNVLGNFDQKA